MAEKRFINAWDLIEWLDNVDLENHHRLLKGRKAKFLDTNGVRHMIATVPTVDAVELPTGRPGDYLEWDIGIGETRFHYISSIVISTDSVRYDIGAMCPVVNHSAIVRILTPEEMEREMNHG